MPLAKKLGCAVMDQTEESRDAETAYGGNANSRYLSEAVNSPPCSRPSRIASATIPATMNLCEHHRAAIVIILRTLQLANALPKAALCQINPVSENN